MQINWDDKILVNTDVIAKFLGVGNRHIQQITKDGILSANSIKKGRGFANQYDLIPTVIDYIEHLRKKTKERTVSEGVEELEEEKLQAEVDYKRTKADIAQMELKELEGRMHSAEDIESITTDLVLAIRSALLSLPGRLAVDVAEARDAAEVSEIIRANVYDILDELSQYEYDPEEYRRRVRERQGWLEKRQEPEIDE